MHAHVPQALANRFKGPWSHDYEAAYRRLQARGQLLRPDVAGLRNVLNVPSWCCLGVLP